MTPMPDPTPAAPVDAPWPVLTLCLALSRELAACPCGDAPAGPPWCPWCACLVGMLRAADTAARQQAHAHA